MSNSTSPPERGNLPHDQPPPSSRREGINSPGAAPEENDPPAARCLATAQDRLLLYLKCLNISPGRKQLSLALEALARMNGGDGDHPVTPAAMRLLRDLLRTEARVRENTRHAKLYSTGLFTRDPEGLESAPPVNRGHMIPVKFEQLPEWLSTESFFTNLVIQLRPLLIPLFILLNILLLIALFFWL